MSVFIKAPVWNEKIATGWLKFREWVESNGGTWKEGMLDCHEISFPYEDNELFLDDNVDQSGKKVVVDNLDGPFTFNPTSKERGWGKRKIGMVGVVHRHEYGDYVSVTFPDQDKLSLFRLSELRLVID